ncbi:hypothetical protein HSBAA_04760 [Vreelandella sulfidaeris]|uniref:Uncharacterized protein n=1 Tax=Vreelandella sulfidaeris TaxID=115553 RepID=A0A455TZZ7_9GAMM|nr:hypothetical protein HSBAA_04760 [Halomonas sulfidaeris]
MAFFPISLLFQWIFGGVLADWALVPRVVVSTLMLTPVMVFVFIPLYAPVSSPGCKGKWSPLDLVARWRHTQRSS